MTTLYEEIAKFENSGLTALYYENKKFSYKELISNIRKMVNYLRSCGIKKGDVVTTVLPNLPITITLFYALNALGAIQNIVYPLTPIDQIIESMARTNSKSCVLLITLYQDNKELLIDSNYNFFFVNPFFDNSFIKRNIIYFKFEKPKENHHFFLIDKYHNYDEDYNISSHNSSLNSIYLHSGGTTSTPKVIALSDDSLNNLAVKVKDIIEYNLLGKSMLAVLPTFHGFGLGMGVHAPLTNGATSAIMMKFNPNKVVKWINQKKINFIIGVPELYLKLLNTPSFLDSELKNLEFCFVGGDNVHQSLIERFNLEMEKHHSSAKLLEGYGLTETVTVCSVNTKSHFKKGSVGQPLTGLKVRVYDDDMNMLKPGEIGEIFISGDTLMNEYLGDLEATSKTKISINGEQYIKTGDIGYVDDDNYIFLKGRKKRMFIISGFNVYPGEVEKIVTELDEIQSASLEFFDKPKIHLNLYCIKNKNINIDDDKLRDLIMNALKSKLLKYSLPKNIIFLNEFPKTRVGKVDHKSFIDTDV